MRADRFAAVAVALLTVHDLADHVVQTDDQAAGPADGTSRGKADPRPGYWEGAMLGHLAGQAAAQGAALALLHRAGIRLTPGRALAGLALSIGTHGFLDRRWPVTWLLEHTGSDRFASPRVSVTPLRTPHMYPGEVPPIEGPLPLHGPHLADQALHKTICLPAAAVIAGVGR